MAALSDEFRQTSCTYRSEPFRIAKERAICQGVAVLRRKIMPP